MSTWPEVREHPAPGRRRGRRSGTSPDPDGPGAALPAGGPHPEDDPGDPEQVARSICLRALTGAPKTRQQLADLLAKRGIPEEAAERVLDRFGEVGLIDDAAFARAWVTSRQAGRGLARRALKAELRAKGVDGEVAEEAVALVDDQDEWEAARRLVQRRLSGLRRFDRATAERRLVGMLARKGYGAGLAAWVVREALDEDRSGEDAEEPGAHGEQGLDAWLS
ncbi:regulatory protein RecX [Geodermatophilus sp. DF01-2]|uniref:regulatory protein RecX n=1 Tax=Geodermatophilus sp. DF01-2 TaxID=2559610 RepID=UPI0010739864|nr:regulatory protein RecX [Geodermatophilus sp. DF01_2]TFV61960.1 regulatory protein RecX [Geodermatophilus sp. DF01_2]